MKMDKVQVQDSSDCCIHSKFSSSHSGYFQDDQLSFFVKKLHRRSPIIHRGYYIRFQALDEVFKSWWQSVYPNIYKKFQIISLGAGYDSSYWRLKSKNELPPNCHYVEIDFPEVMKRKYEQIKNTISSEKIPLEKHPAIVLCSNEYSMLGLDLTDISTLEKCLTSVGIDKSIPTLFVSEVSITYIEPQSSEAVMRWIQSQFTNSLFVAYEQVYPYDAFGLIMRFHFNQVGCPLMSITKYPDEESQYERYKTLGWPNCNVINMFDLFSSFSYSEKTRIQKLEMFDEYEMWHEKCHHYVLAWTNQGVLSGCLNSLSTKAKCAVDISCFPIVKKTLNWKFIGANDIIQRFGHQVTPLSSLTMLISGGFGMVNKKHQRLGDVVMYHKESMKHASIIFEDEKLIGKRMFHTMNKLSNDTIVIMGGRSSPKEVFDEVFVFNCSFKSMNDDEMFLKISQGLHCLTKKDKTIMPLPLWRHSASLVELKGTEHIVVFGGCSRKNPATNKCFVLNTDSWTWLEVDVQKHTPSPRHSHSAVTYENSHVIITGGLAEDEHILQSIHIFNSEDLEWNTMDVPGLLPRYSHTSHILRDHLFLVGGVTSISSHKLGVGVINLKTLKAIEVSLPAQDPEYPILLCNHASYIQEDKIFIIGGGGNCFSFGTHFNKRIVCINTEELVKEYNCFYLQ